MKNTIIGYRKFNSKAGKSCCIVIIVREGTENDIKHGLVGMVSDEIFIPESCHSLIDESVLDKELITHYNVVGGRPYLENIEIK